MSEVSEHQRALEAFQSALPAFSAPPAMRRIAGEQPAVLDAALAYLEDAWSRVGDVDRSYTALAVIVVSASAEHLRRFTGEHLFRLPHPAGYRQLVPLLIGALDDAGLEALVVEAARSDDELVAANAFNLHYHAYGWPDRFTLTESGENALRQAVELLREHPRDESSPLVAALQRFDSR